MNELIYKKVLASVNSPKGYLATSTNIDSLIGVKSVEQVGRFTLDALLNSSVFVVSNSILTQFFEQAATTAYKKPPRFELDIPFESVFFEGASLPLLVYTSPKNHYSEASYGILIKEHREGYFFTAVPKEPSNGRTLVGFLSREDWDQMPDDVEHAGFCGIVHTFIATFLTFIREKKAINGFEEINQTVRIKDGRSSHLHKINTVVKIILKEERKENEANGLVIDRSHRWEVAGHWRTILGIGKNRSGEYTVKGATWVMPHVKGPEDLPLVRKVRVYPEVKDAHQ